MKYALFVLSFVVTQVFATGSNHHNVYDNSVVNKGPQELAQKFFCFASSLQKKKQKLLKENEHLESIRDWLLPMLMNGQVTIK